MVGQFGVEGSCTLVEGDGARGRTFSLAFGAMLPMKRRVRPCGRTAAADASEVEGGAGGGVSIVCSLELRVHIFSSIRKCH